MLSSHETIEVTVLLVKNACTFRLFVLINSTVTHVIVCICCTHMQWPQKQVEGSNNMNAISKSLDPEGGDIKHKTKLEAVF